MASEPLLNEPSIAGDSQEQFYGEIGRMGAKQENVGNSTKGGSEGRAWTKWRRNGCARPTCSRTLYRRPCDRKRVTGSTTGTASRRKIQRATAKPIAA